MMPGHMKGATTT